MAFFVTWAVFYIWSVASLLLFPFSFLGRRETGGGGQGWQGGGGGGQGWQGGGGGQGWQGGGGKCGWIIFHLDH